MVKLDKKWKRDNMNISLMFDSWGLAHSPGTVLHIVGQHADNKTSLILLNRALCRAYTAEELPGVMREYSPALNTSIIQYLCDVQEGASEILDYIEGTC